jgi:hypothetical protein
VGRAEIGKLVEQVGVRADPPTDGVTVVDGRD